MKKLNLFERSLRRVLFLLLSLLGFTSCGDSDPDTPPCEYGTPVVSFKVSGKVTNIDGVGIPNIGVVFKSEGTQIYQDTLRTDTNGAYTQDFVISPIREISIEFVDTDGEDNGSYQSTFVDHTLTDGKPDGNWTTDYDDLEIDVTLTE